MSAFSRRTLLKASFAGGLLVSFGGLFGRAAAQETDDLQTILDLAATTENLSCVHYYTALTDSEIQLTPRERSILIAALDADYQHLELLVSKGAHPITDQFYTPRIAYRNRENFANVTEQIEMLFAAAYLAAVEQTSEAGDSLLAATFAQLAMIEQVHVALARQIGDLLPNHIALGQGLFARPSQALAPLQPFIEGGADFPDLRTFPGDLSLQDLVGDNGVQAVDPVSP